MRFTTKVISTLGSVAMMGLGAQSAQGAAPESGSFVPYAGPVATASIGSLPSLGVSNDLRGLDQKKRVVTTTAMFGKRTANKVRLTSIKICYSGPQPTAAYIHTKAQASGGTVNWDNGVAKKLYSGQCTSYSINKDYSKASNGQVVTIINYVTSSGQTAVYAGFRR